MMAPAITAPPTTPAAMKVASEPDSLLQVLTNPAYHFKRIGLEAGPLSQWLFSAHHFFTSI
jgi:hypothetical protein